jgi:hypothetical protein
MTNDPSNEHLATYLNDHLAGAVAALELLEHLEKRYADTSVGRIVAEVRADVAADRDELEALMGRLEVRESGPRKAAAWLAERLTRLKLRLDDPSGGPLRLLESVEAVSLGIQGKHALWRVLAAVAPGIPALQGLDYERLLQSAAAQGDRLEPVRLEAAKVAFGAPA